MSEGKDTFTLYMDGVPENGKDLRLGVFVEKLSAFRSAVREADSVLTGEHQSSFDFFID